MQKPDVNPNTVIPEGPTGYQVYIFDHVCDHEVGGDND